MFSFYKALFKNPRAVGAVSPSSKRLATAIAAHIPSPHTGLVIELGGGTGVITKAILDRGINEQQIIVIENNEHLAKKLLKRFPNVNTIHGSAAHLSDLLGERTHQVQTIVSGLPLLALPKNTTQEILQQIDTVLKPGGYYIQFTYGLQKGVLENNPHYEKVTSTRVWLNAPPARIDVFKRRSEDTP